MSEYYRRTANKPEKNVNRQNLHISLAYEMANFALLELMKMGITVIKVTIEGRNPAIEVMPSKACQALDGHVHATINRPGRRTVIKRAYLNHCLVQWETRNLH